MDGGIELRNLRADNVAEAKKEARALMQQAFGMKTAIEYVFVEKQQYWE